MSVLATWPEGLPHTPSLGGWTGGPQANAASFQPETGPSIERPRTTATPLVFDAVIPRFTAGEVAKFDDFVLRVLAQGALPFLFRDPVTGDLGRFRIVRGDPLYAWQQVAANRWTLTIKMMRLP